MKKIIIISALPILTFIIIIIAMAGTGSQSAAVPVAQVATVEKVEEYAETASKMAAPWEIVILTDAIDAEEKKQSGIEDRNPLITTMEFLFLSVDVEHYEIVGWETDEDGEDEPIYDWVYSRTDKYTAKNEILGYINITDEELLKLTPEKLIEKTRKTAEEKSNDEWRYSIDYSANTEFETVLKNYVNMDDDNIKKVMELYNSDYIKSWLPEDVLEKINGIKAEYGMYQSAELSDAYTSYKGITFKDGETEVVYFNQGDGRWKNEPYGNSNIGKSGCGPSSMAIVISTLTEYTYDPVFMADWSYKNGYYANGSGSYHTLIPGAAKAFGLSVSGCTASEPDKIANALSEGKLVVALMSKGHFTSNGHYIVLRGVTENGKILVADPGSHDRSKQAWDFQIILSEARKGAGAGGPFWIIGN